jgi:putative CocE/NonD family hydrolase
MNAIVVTKDLPVPMRDGVILRANLYTPPEIPFGCGPFPTLIFRTPYSKDEGDEFNERTFNAAAMRGYAVLVQDVRGRYASGGDFTPYVNEGRDGYDTIEWAARQGWSNGKVGTFGLSYPGGVQWFAAVENPPSLKAMVPAMSASTMRQCIYFGGVFEVEWIKWAYGYMSPDVRVRNDLPGPRTCDEAEEVLSRMGVENTYGCLPLRGFNLLHDTCPWFYDWLDNAPYTDYWNFGDLGGKYEQVKAAVLNLSGWHDEPYGPTGATENYCGLLAARASWPDPKTKLIMGPWTHGVDAVESNRAGDRTLQNAALNYDDLVLDWMDLHLKGEASPSSEWPQVRLYQMGTDRWIDAPTWPPSGSDSMTLYLEAAGTVSMESPPISSRSYTSDSADPVKDQWGTNFGAYDLHDLKDRPDVLTFETAPLDQAIAVLGPIHADIFVSADVPDFDLFVKLLDVDEDGTAFNLMSPGMEVVRASYRNQTPGRVPVSPGDVIHLRFDKLMTGNTFLKGHRIRLYLCSSWYPIYARNLQTGASEIDSASSQPGRITVHFGGDTASRVTLPVRSATASAVSITRDPRLPFYRVDLDPTVVGHREMGRLYAEALLNTLPNFQEATDRELKQSLEGANLTLEAAAVRAEGMMATMPAEYRDEIIGMAERFQSGSDDLGNGLLSYNKVIVSVLESDILDLPACSAAAVFGGASTTGQTIVGRNNDWAPDPDVDNWNALFVFHDGDRSIGGTASLGELFPTNMFNRWHMFAGSLDASHDNLPHWAKGPRSVTCDLRWALEHYQTLAEMEDFLVERGNAGSYAAGSATLVADAATAHVFEYDTSPPGGPTGAIRTSRSGLIEGVSWDIQDAIVSVNGFLLPGGVDNHTTDLHNRCRFDSYKELFEQMLHGPRQSVPIGVPEMQRVMGYTSDDGGAPTSGAIFRMGPPNDGGATFQSLVMRLDTLELWLAFSAQGAEMPYTPQYYKVLDGSPFKT